MLTIILILVVMLVSVIIFKLNAGKSDKRTLIYILIFSIVALVTGPGMWLLKEKVRWTLMSIFLLAVALFLVLGLIHVKTMLRLLWAKRDTYSAAKDSFIKEISFSVGLSCLMVLLALVPFGYLIHRYDLARSLAGLVLIFPIPFIVIKTYDFFVQIPGKEFDKKWFYERYPFDPNQWTWENKISVGFIVTDSVANEKKWFRKKAKFEIVVPRDQELRLIFRFALKAYDKKPSVPVQELGYEDNITPFWWLFSVKFNLWKPDTWGHTKRYLDPYESLSTNNIENGTFIRAKRVILNNTSQI